MHNDPNLYVFANPWAGQPANFPRQSPQPLYFWTARATQLLICGVNLFGTDQWIQVHHFVLNNAQLLGLSTDFLTPDECRHRFQSLSMIQKGMPALTQYPPLNLPPTPPPISLPKLRLPATPPAPVPTAAAEPKNKSRKRSLLKPDPFKQDPLSKKVCEEVIVKDTSSTLKRCLWDDEQLEILHQGLLNFGPDYEKIHAYFKAHSLSHPPTPSSCRWKTEEILRVKNHSVWSPEEERMLIEGMNVLRKRPIAERDLIVFTACTFWNKRSLDDLLKRYYELTGTTLTVEKKPTFTIKSK